MKWIDIIKRVETLNKDNLLIKDYRSRTYSVISVFHKDVRLFDITKKQAVKLEKLGYNYELFFLD